MNVGELYPEKKAWRSDSLIRMFTKEKVASEIIKYEYDVLGNEDVLSAFKVARKYGIKLGEITADKMRWITPKKSVAGRYGEPEEFVVPEDSVILVDDGDDGYLIIWGWKDEV